ncbi:DUF6201 family protein [Xenorhabdus sp. PR6a]|uniref:DUF6201 family protein n=1 Tax=Xenorhabdus sp. PR6a TaxID=3025877 RepID=UPI00235A3E57|nr:DUF6201 family protein [Xenorhabdus sp. PR6a]MDC9581078.1 DUF6201 family protein [Xenorhabdus sp. PR6a]
MIKYGLISIFFLWWFFLSHVTFFPSSFKEGEFEKDNYLVEFYSPLPVNLFGMYYNINYPRPYFAVLYKDNNYVGQSSPFYIDNDYAMIGSAYSFPNDKHDYFYIVCAYCDGYDISIKEKKWWSKILQYFH